MRLVWVSRHDLKPENWEILRKAFGKNVEILQYKDTVNNVGELIAFADKFNADGFIVVLPPHMIQELLSMTDKPIYRFIVERKIKNGHVEFIPIGLERIKKITIETEKIVQIDD